MNVENLLNKTLEEFLMECVSKKIEEVSELPKMLQNIGYLDRKDEFIAKTTACEILDIDDAFIESYLVSGNEIQIKYQIDYIMQTFVGSEAIWRVQGSASAELSIPDSADWSVFETQPDKFFENFEKFKELVRFRNVVYSDIECDTLN